MSCLLENQNISEALDNAVKDISKRVAKMDMENIDSAEIDDGDSNSLVTTSKGDYKLTIVFYTNSFVMRAITENMKRGKVATEEDIKEYTTEFFNILCGHVVTALNKKNNAAARFGIPIIVKGMYSDNELESTDKLQKLFYKSNYGIVEVKTIYQAELNQKEQ